MTLTPLDCGTVIERLIGGERSGSDPELGEHVGSCLSCFRTASDLRGLPQLREQLLRAQKELHLPDPGEAFWTGFPSTVSAAWERTQEKPVAAAPVRPRARQRLSGWASAAWAWLQQPVPAAFAGAACSAIVVVMMTRSPARPVVTEPRATVELPGEGDPRLSITAGGLALGSGLDDSIKDLDVAELRVLRSELEHSLQDGIEGAGAETGAEAGTASGKGQRQAQAQARGRALAEGQAESNPTALSDDLDELSETGLAVLAENLEGPI